MKKNIYMYQPNYFYGKDAYLPYAAGVLAAYAWSDDNIKEEYALRKLGYARENIQSVVNGLNKPYLCAFSCYTWNYEYNKMLACAIKKAFPSCKIVFGGHQIAPGYNVDSEEFVDIFIYDEGEVAFKGLLLALCHDGDLNIVTNIRYKTSSGIWINTRREIVTETDFPSPYLMGLFDDMLDGSPLSFTPTLETNRGCPFSCMYCDWGIYKSKLRQFPIDKVKAEIDWFSGHKIDLIFGADSNFGIFERDEEIIDYMIYKKRTTGYPKKFRVSYTKNTGERVFRINQKLNLEGMCKGATLSFQSMNKQTLEAIGRKNVPLKYFSELMEMYNAENIPTYSEIIMGLPEETYSSFCDGIDLLLESGQHTSVNIYLCELLPNSAMAKQDYMEKYKIRIADTILNQYHCWPSSDDVVEHSKIVTATSSLSFEEYKKMYYYSLVIQTFHCLGLTRYIAVYLHYECKHRYQDFYQKLLEWFIERNDTVAGYSFEKIAKVFEEFIDGNKPLAYTDQRFGNTVWPLDEAWYLEVLYNIDNFYKELGKFLDEKYTGFMSETVSRQLLEYQEKIMYTPGMEEKEVVLNYDFYTYFRKIFSGEYNKLNQGLFRYKTKFGNNIDTWDKFATEIVWYGRKGGKNHLELELV